MWREWKRYEVIIADNKRGREHQIQALIWWSLESCWVLDICNSFTGLLNV